MKAHLGFLRSHKAVLRLSLNAQEDLVVNGQKPPTERGVCRHLLAKVDRAAVDGALAREPLKSDTEARVRFLGGAVRLTGDAGVLLAYLEALAGSRDRQQAAQAFGDVVERLDFAALSPARLGRLLQVMLDVFAGPERTRALLGLLALPAARAAMDAAGEALPPEVLSVVAPLRAASRAAERARGGRPVNTSEPGVLDGLRSLLALPEPMLRALPERQRLGLLDLAFSPGVPAEQADRAGSALLPSVPVAGRDGSRLAVRYAATLLARQQDDRARAVLAPLKDAHPDFRTPARWLAALDAPRVGRMGLHAAVPETGTRLQPATWLDHPREAWVKILPKDQEQAITTEHALHASLALPQVAPAVAHGLDGDRAYLAVTGPGRPLSGPLREPEVALEVAVQVARILRALALAGTALPALEPGRFLVVLQPHVVVTLADLSGAHAASPTDADRSMAALVPAFLSAVGAPSPGAGPGNNPPDLAGLVTGLQRLTGT